MTNTQNQKILFSVVIPYYNCAAYIQRAIDSVLSQGGCNWELILVDDGSTEDSLKLLGDYLPNPAIRLIHQKNKGPGAARNHGIRQARGNYIWFLDCDDELLPDALNKVHKFFEQNPDTMLLVGGHLNRLPSGTEKKHFVKLLSQDSSANFSAFIRKQLGGFSNGAIIIHHEALNSFQYPENIRNNEDLVLYALILANYTCQSIPSLLARIHSRPDSLRHHITSTNTAVGMVVQHLFDSNKLPPKLFSYREEFMVSRYLSQFRSLCNAGRKVEARQAYISIIRLHPRAILKWAYLKKFLRLSIPT